MAVYDAKITTGSGYKSIVIRADNIKEAREKAEEHGGQILSLKKKFVFDLAKGMTPTERNIFMIRLSTMAGSKVPISQALDLMSKTFSGRIGACSAGLYRAIMEDNLDLITAIEEDTKNFPPATSALIRAGISTGETWRALKDAAEFEYLIANIQKGAMMDLLVSFVTFTISLVLIVGTAYYLAPMFLTGPMMDGFQSPFVDTTVIIAKIMAFIQLLLFAIVASLGWLSFFGRKISPDKVDRWILKMPFYKDIVLSRNAYVVLYKFSLLIKSGVNMEKSLYLTAVGSPKGALRSDLERAIYFVEQGKDWTKALETLHPTDRASLSASSDRKDIGRTLDLISTQYKDLYMSRMQTLAPTVKTISGFFLTLAGFFIFVITTIPMLEMTSQM